MSVRYFPFFHKSPTFSRLWNPNFFMLLHLFFLILVGWQVFEYNGSAIVAMVGKNCFAIASDRRLGVNLQTVATDFQRIYKIHDKLFIGLSGLGTDAQTLYISLMHRLFSIFLIFSTYFKFFSERFFRVLLFLLIFSYFVIYGKLFEL